MKPSAALLPYITEKNFQQTVIELARIKGWLVYHTFDSRRSQAGFPDLVMVRDGQLIFAELKSETGELRPEQKQWLEALREVLWTHDTPKVFMWRPSSWQSIVAALS